MSIKKAPKNHQKMPGSRRDAFSMGGSLQKCWGYNGKTMKNPMEIDDLGIAPFFG